MAASADCPPKPAYVGFGSKEFGRRRAEGLPGERLAKAQTLNGPRKYDRGNDPGRSL